MDLKQIQVQDVMVRFQRVYFTETQEIMATKRRDSWHEESGYKLWAEGEMMNNANLRVAATKRCIVVEISVQKILSCL